MEKEWKKKLIHLFCSTVKSSFISVENLKLPSRKTRLINTSDLQAEFDQYQIGFSIGIGNLIDDVSLGDHVSIVLCWLQQFCTGGALIRLAFSPRGFCCKPTKGPCFDRNQPSPFCRSCR
ncbi:hypothetical protein T06_567 [Trichinella sp. T6]|nr:hypothetical protein T06_567 [Trichinella sp. T6]